MRTRPTRQLALSALAAVLTALAALSFQVGHAHAAAEPGVVSVKGVTTASSTTFNLNDIGSPSVSVPGQTTKGWSLRQVLLEAEERTNGAIDIDTFQDDVVLSRSEGSQFNVSKTKVAQKSNDTKLPIYYLDSEGNTAMWEPGKEPSIYLERNPEILVPKSSSTLEVAITPGGPIKLKAGDTKLFKAKVSNAGSSSVQLSWLVNGSQKQSGGSASNGQFEFEFRDEGTFQVSVFASATGMTQGADVVTVQVGKAPKKKPKKKEEPTDDDPGYTDNYYVPGYTDYGGGGYGTGSGSTSGVPGSGDPNPSPKPDKKPKDQQPPVDSGLETVSGQLIDPNATITEITPPDSPSASGSEETPQADESSGGGGLSTGVKTALGLGALLGLGGLAEAGAFAGGLRRFRFRP